ncbi:YfjI family protein [Pseudomonas aeruginosa]|nr:YfjI family protein [Pseudomonas aeruginosa]
MYYSRSKLPALGTLHLPVLERTLLWRASEQLAINSQVHPEMVALTLLAGISAAAQGRYDVSLPYGAIRPTSIYAAVIVGSGYGKSVVYEKVMNPIQEVQRQLRKKKHDRTIADEGRGFDGVRCRVDAENKQEMVREFQLLYKDATPEGLFLSLKNSIPSAALATDEAEIFFKSAMGGARGHLNTLWDGRDTIVMRASKDDVVLEDVRLMLLLMSQPEVMRDYVQKRGALGRDSGMFARFVVCAPPSVLGTRVRSLQSSQNWGVWLQAEERLRSLALENTLLAYAPFSARNVLNFTDEAAAYWIGVLNEIERQVGPGGFFAGAVDHAAKLGENIARVAALIHVFEGAAGDISEETLRIAVELCCFYSKSFFDVFMPMPQEFLDAQVLQGWFDEQRKFGVNKIRYNHVRQYAPASLRDKGRLRGAIDVLMSQGWILVYSEGRARYINLNPYFNGGMTMGGAPMGNSGEMVPFSNYTDVSTIRTRW